MCAFVISYLKNHNLYDRPLDHSDFKENEFTLDIEDLEFLEDL